MLPLPELNDRSVQQLLKQARDMIPKLMPEWTDHNDHDPGITFLEMLAWLTEMQEFRLNRITAGSELKFLKLLDLLPEKARRAMTDITFENTGELQIIPRGTPVAADNLPFETMETVCAVPARLQKVIVADGAHFYDYSSFNIANRANFPAFGKEVKPGNRLYLGFDRDFPCGRSINFKIYLQEDYPIPFVPLQGNGADFFIPAGKVAWEYCPANEEGVGELNRWAPVEILGDESLQLSFSGRIIMQIPSRMGAARIQQLNTPELFWISAKVVDAGYETAPWLREITLNTVPVIHGNTMSETFLYHGTGAPNQSLRIEGYLPLHGRVEVQVRGDDGYFRTWSDATDGSNPGAEGRHYRLERDMAEQKLIISFGDGEHGEIPPPGAANIQVICSQPDFEEKRMVGVSDRLPGQSFMLNWLRPGLPLCLETLQLQVGEKPPGSTETLWENWTWVADFDLSRGGDCHFRFDELTNEICFGNNERGAIPGRSAENLIRIISCRTGGGVSGNIKEGKINSLPGKVTNRFPATGGRNPESIEDAKRKVAQELKKQGCAITVQDYETIVKETPGLRVARVKAIPLYVKGLKDYPAAQAPAQMTVVAVPYSDVKKPVPSRGFLETIRLHLEPYRLITTEVHVIAPEYVKIRAHAVVVVAAHIVFGPEKVIQDLNRFLSPSGSEGAPGWPFGGTVRKSDLIGVISKIDGVEWVKELWLDYEGEGARREPGGDIAIPPHSLVYCDDQDPHDIQIATT